MRSDLLGPGEARDKSPDPMRSPARRTEVVPCALAAGIGLALGVAAACAPLLGWPTTSCTRDSDCGLATLRCNTVTGQCEQRCQAPAHLCGDRCARCCDDTECDADETCDPASGACVRRCSPLEHLCNGRCARCCDDGECRTDERCNPATGACEPRCAYPLHACADGRCARCCANQECHPSERCDLDAGACVDVCSGKRYCPLADGGSACADCCVDGDCGGGRPDSGFSCVKGSCECGPGLRFCAGACISNRSCCHAPDDCEAGYQCDAGLCCDTVGTMGCYSF